MIKKLFSVFILFAASFNTSISQTVSFHGYGNAGYTFYNKPQYSEVYQLSYFEGKLKTDIKYNDKIDGQLYLKGSSTDNKVKLEEMNIRFHVSDYIYLRLGNIKKPFGYEYLEAEEELKTINRSYANEIISGLGYTGKAVGIMGYYKYSKDHPEFPFSYYVAVFKDEATFTSLITRFSYHINDFGIGINYMAEKIQGYREITAHGIASGIFVENRDYNSMLEMLLVQDPYESISRINQYNGVMVLSVGARLSGSYNFRTDMDFLKGIEPVLLLSIFNTDTKTYGIKTVQILGGANFYLHEKIRARVNGDLRLTKPFDRNSYNNKESRLIFSIQMIF